jgi:hypothetical protein
MNGCGMILKKVLHSYNLFLVIMASTISTL